MTVNKKLNKYESIALVAAIVALLLFKVWLTIILCLGVLVSLFVRKEKADTKDTKHSAS